MKKIFIFISLLLILSGCTLNKEENKKIAYLDYKSELQSKNDLVKEDNLDYNSYFNIKRENEELIKYSIIIRPKNNMNNVKALLIHDYMEEEAYPSIGILDEPVELNKENNDKIELKGDIHTIKDLSNVNFKLYLEYTTLDGKVNKIYKEVTRG